MSKNTKKRVDDGLTKLGTYLNDAVQGMNSSKLFAGLMIVTLNVASKFTTIKISKTMESYLKFSFSRNALIFAISWVGSRDIYIAFVLTLLFIVLFDFLFNEESSFCVFPETFCDYHISLLDTNDNAIITPEEIKQAEDLLVRAKKQSSVPATDSIPTTIIDENKHVMAHQTKQVISQYPYVY
jgi:hypothetical protein